MFKLAEAEIGGGVVRRIINSGGTKLTPGMRLTGDQVRAFRPVNRDALINKGYLEVFPKGDGSVAPSANGGERFVISLGFGKFTVIEGSRLTDTPLDREQAYALAGQEPPIGKPSRPRKAKAVLSA